MKWFRFYDEVLDDPKVQKLSLSHFKTWINLLCISNPHRNSRGELPGATEIAFHLRLSEAKAQDVLRDLNVPD